MKDSRKLRHTQLRNRLYALGLVPLVCVAAMMALQGPACADEWATYLHDNNRSGWTRESLEPPFVQRWVFKHPYPPQKAYAPPRDEVVEGNWEKDRVDFDDANHVAVVGDAVYVGSSGGNKVCCLDAATGAVRWNFLTGGPVRLAPSVVDGRVFFGSDDGYVYCLSAADGALIWKVHAGATDERLLGSGKMISPWPVRTGVLVDGGVAYFAAGIYPHEGVYICAVRAEDGKTVWRNDTMGQATAGSRGYLGAPGYEQLSPQGYLLASESTLFVPSARALPAAFDRADGHMVYQASDSWRGSGLVGGSYALLVGDHLLVGANQAVGYAQDTGRGGFAWFPCRKLVVAEDAAYTATDAVPTRTSGEALAEEVRRLDFEGYADASRRKKALQRKLTGPSRKSSDLTRALKREKGKEEDQQNKEHIADLEKQLAEVEAQIKDLKDQMQNVKDENIEPSVKWRTPCKCAASLILAGDVLFGGGQDVVVAFDAGTGEEVWRQEVEGRARGLAAADGALYVSTDTGMQYCFSQPLDAPAAVVPPAEAARPFRPDDPMAAVYGAAADAIVQRSGVTRGYCLVLGVETGRLAYELAQRTELQIYCLEADMAKVQAARRALDAAHLLGGRVYVEQGDASQIPYSNYFANLTVSESLLHTGDLPEITDELVHKIKPCGGVVCLGWPANAPGPAQQLDAAKLRQWMDELGLGECRVDETGGLWATLERGKLPGAGEWTHQYAEPGNSTCGNDKLVKCPMRVLWYGDPGPDKMLSRHQRGTGPLSVNGRLLMQGNEWVMCYDAYNGLKYWEHKVPGAKRGGMSSRASNITCNEDILFVAVGDKCLRFDIATGETQTSFDQPPVAEGDMPAWGYIANVGELLYGSSGDGYRSKRIFAIDIESGKPRWVYDATSIADITIAIGDGHIFLADATEITDEQRGEAVRESGNEDADKADVRMAVCLDAKTGEKLWERPVDLTDCGRVGHPEVGRGTLMAMYKDGVLVFCGAHSNGHHWPQFLGGEFAERRIVVLDADNGNLLWDKALGYRIRPLIVDDTLVAEPWGFALRTGEQKMRTHPLTGEEVPWQFERPGHHCGCVAGNENVLFFRSAYIAYYDLEGDYGTLHFGAQRPGCWINFIPANGLMLIPEASSGCQCLFAIQSTVVLEPCETGQAWGLFSTPGPHTPIRQMALNLGAPGDRRDPAGTLWLAYPRPWSRMQLGLETKVEFLPGCGYFSHDTHALDVKGTDYPWLFASGCAGMSRFTLPLLEPGQEPAAYAVRLHFAETAQDQPGGRVFDVKLQGETVLEDFDIVQAAGGPMRATVREFEDIEVRRGLTIEFVPRSQEPTALNGPLLNAIELKQVPLPRMQAAVGEFAQPMGVYNLGYWCADFLRRQTQSDLVLFPGSALWAAAETYPAGQVTLGKLLARINDLRLVTYRVSGQELLAYFARPQVMDRFNPYHHTRGSAEGNPLYYAGLEVTYDPDQQTASFDLDPAKEYTLLTVCPFSGRWPQPEPPSQEVAQQLAAIPGLQALDRTVLPETIWDLLEREAAGSFDFTRRYPEPLAVWKTWQQQFEAAMGFAITEWPEDKPTVTLDAIADARVGRGSPDATNPTGGIGNDGGDKAMRDASHSMTYLRFRVEVPGKPIMAKLRLKVGAAGYANSNDAGHVYVTEDPWDEMTVTYNNRPGLAEKVGDLGEVALDKVEERVLFIDLRGRDEISLVLEPTTTDAAGFLSRESEHPPQLIIAYEPD